MDTGGVLGFRSGQLVDRRLRGGEARYQVALSAGGVGAAFASAYHSPISATLYVVEHFGVRPTGRSTFPLSNNERGTHYANRRLAYAIVGAAVGYVAAVRVFGSKPLFANVASHRGDVVVRGGVAVVPVVFGSRLFRWLRNRTSTATLRSSRTQQRNLASAIVAGAVFFVAPNVAGNGMEAIRQSAGPVGLALILTLAVAKLVATTATLGSGAPGGAFSPTMAVGVGWALLSFELARRCGVTLPGDHWAGVLAAMSISVAVGLRSPLVALTIVAEMTGDIRLVPFTVPIVVVAVALDRFADWLVLPRAGQRRLTGDPTVPQHREGNPNA